MASSMELAVAAVVVHSILFISIFDIYFTSPIEQGMVPQNYFMTPPAKRLVLFVADGLRADTVFSLDAQGNTPAPYVRGIVESEGRWGVSHTHVPTESRPGHVALMAGFYEDVSAVTRGWQENPVDFDSVFNQSHHTWSWGSPDILPMFARGAGPGKVDTFMYDAVWEDFADSNASKLDSWVFEEVGDTFKKAESNEEVAQMLSNDRIVFFLHLLGIDTNGHAHRPTSQEVLDNLRLVDDGVKRTVSMINSYYGDNDTAFLFTSDHGMTNWGSHGAGLPDETMTPLVAWGAGVKSPLSSRYSKVVQHDSPLSSRYSKVVQHDDSWSKKWDLDRLERVDVEQADIAPLMAALIGVPIPVNSEGVLPWEYIHYNGAFHAASLFANARQLLEQVRVKEDRIYSTSLPLTFRPFSKLKGSGAVDMNTQIESLIQEKHFEKAIYLSHQLIEYCKDGIQYYHTYHRFTLKFVITLGFTGWVICILIVILEESIGVGGTGRRRNIKEFSIVLPCATFLLVALLLWLQSSPLLYYLYYSIPIFTWNFIFKRRAAVAMAWQLTRQNSSQLFVEVCTILFSVGGLELLCLSFFFRQVLSLLLVLLSIWPFFTQIVRKQLRVCIMWLLTCLLLAVFPLLPVVGRNANYAFVLLSGVATAGMGMYLLLDTQMNYLLTYPAKGFLKPSLLMKSQFLLLAFSAIIPGLTNWYFAQKLSIPVYIHGFSWFTLVFSTVTPHFTTSSLPGRLLHLSVSFYTVFLLLSLTFEAVFILLLCSALYLWITAEELLASKGSKVCSFWESVVVFKTPSIVTLVPGKPQSRESIDLEDVRRVTFCIFFGVLSFFGIGNIASVNTFDPTTVYSFLTVFSPFVMGALILWKMVIPFIFVSVTFNSIMTLFNRPLKGGLLLMLMMSDIMGLNFFFLVRDHGSWLEIGVSISHYVIMMTMIIGIVVLMILARLLTGVAVVPRKIEDHLY